MSASCLAHCSRVSSGHLQPDTEILHRRMYSVQATDDCTSHRVATASISPWLRVTEHTNHVEMWKSGNVLRLATRQEGTYLFIDTWLDITCAIGSNNILPVSFQAAPFLPASP